MRGILMLIMLCCLSCSSREEVPKELVGKWKIYQTKLNQKDISKSADPTNENGLEFQPNGEYISFGNPNHQDKGIYEIQKGNLFFQSKKMSGRTTSKMHLTQDTLQLSMPVDSTKVLFMKLYKMK